MEALRVLAAVTVGSGVSFVFLLVSVSHTFGNIAIFYFWIGTTASLLGFRVGLRALLRARAEDAGRCDRGKRTAGAQALSSPMRPANQWLPLSRIHRLG